MLIEVEKRRFNSRPYVFYLSWLEDVIHRGFGDILVVELPFLFVEKIMSSLQLGTFFECLCFLQYGMPKHRSVYFHIHTEDWLQRFMITWIEVDEEKGALVLVWGAL